jgi:hypothetical protein
MATIEIGLLKAARDDGVFDRKLTPAHREISFKELTIIGSHAIIRYKQKQRSKSNELPSKRLTAIRQQLQRKQYI